MNILQAAGLLTLLTLPATLWVCLTSKGPTTWKDVAIVTIFGAAWRFPFFYTLLWVLHVYTR